MIRYVSWTLENVRKWIPKELHPSKKIYFKRSHKLLLTHKKKLRQKSLISLEVMLSQSRDLAAAYELKELFFHFMKSSNRVETVQRLQTFLLSVQAAL